jgi:hypothetical protein
MAAHRCRGIAPLKTLVLYPQSWQAKAPAPRLLRRVGQALSPANFLLIPRLHYLWWAAGPWSLPCGRGPV